jgi:cell wall-associated NlpC family hydrolase
MLQTADLIGKPFKSGAKGPEEYSCWGLSVEVFRRFGFVLPNYQLDCATIDNGMPTLKKQWVQCAGEIPVPALIVFTTNGMCDHVGVYLGFGKFIHAHETAGVVIDHTDHIFWKRRIEGYYVPGCLE